MRDILACRKQQAESTTSAELAHSEDFPMHRRKLRTDAKVKDVYKIGKTLGTGGEFCTVRFGIKSKAAAAYLS